MATREQVYDAIRKADAAGDAESVRKLGAYLQTMEQAPAAQPQQPQPETTGQMLRRELSPRNLMSAAVRPAVQAVTGIPGIFADATMAGFNLLTGQNNQMPSQATGALLDRFTTRPEGVGRVAEVGSSMLLGSRIPIPQIGQAAPQQLPPRAVGNIAEAGPRAPTLPITQTVQGGVLQNARQAGYVVPPSTVKPTLGRRMAETLGGKTGTEQDAAIRNQRITDRLARRALGLADDAELSEAAIREVRTRAAPGYEAIRSVGRLSADKQYQGQLDEIVKPFTTTSKDFPKLAKNEIEGIVDDLRKESFDSDSAVDAIALLRERSSAAFRAGDGTVGRAFRNAAGAVESLIERNLAARGEDGREVLKAFRESRTLMAKTYTVEKALTTGSVSAPVLARQLKKGAPLSGELRTIGEFGQQFPRAAQEVRNSGSVRNTDMIVGGATSVLGQDPMYLLYPFARMAARNALLSESSQNALLRQAAGVNPALIGGSAPAVNELNQLLR
jgi:hypothetical protein